MPYQPGIPTGTVDLDVDYQNVQDNFTQLDVSFGVDHVPFSNTTPQNGYHTSIHFNPVSTTATNPPNNDPPVIPAATVGYGQLFSCDIDDGVNVDQALFWLTGGNRLAQLTRNFAPSYTTGVFPTYNQGNTFLPGGFILKWGVKPADGLLPVTFLEQFPSVCYGVLAGRSQTLPVPADSAISVGSVSQTGFALSSFTVASNLPIFWVAIGN